MSSGIATPPLLPPLPPEAIVLPPPTECECFIDDRLRRTRRRVRGVDIAGGFVTLSIGIVAYLLVAAGIDHWLISGGLGFLGRLLLWMGLVGGAGTYFVRVLLPPLRLRINPIFAAATIEKSQSTLKNSLINFLLLRGRRQELSAPVYQALERRAASDLSKVPIELAVDRAHIVRLSCVLFGVLLIFCLYLVLSPKSPFRSAARVLWPWSSIEAPTRVTFRDPRPGDATLFFGDSAAVSAEVSGLREGEPVLLIYSTADGQSVNQEIPLIRPEGGYRHQCHLPPGNLGLQQNYDYYLSAGDCQTRRFHIEVKITPFIDVDKATYHFPAYTGIADKTVERLGDLKAIDGTEVTLHATANTEIDPTTAQIDLGCTGRPGPSMTVDGRVATGRFTLKMNRDDPPRPAYDCYQLRFADLQGRSNNPPIRHRIEVIPDLPPKVQLIEPRQEDFQAAEDGKSAVAVAEDGKLAVTVTADDDFALRRVTLRAERDDRSLAIAPLLEKRKPEKPWPGEFQATYNFEPAKLGLKAGDRVQFWVEAEDNKEPSPNRSETGKQWIAVVGPDSQHKQQEKSEGANGGNPQPDKDKSSANQPGEHRNERPNQDKNAEDQPGENAKEKQPPKEAQSSKEGQPPQDNQPPKEGQQDQPQRDKSAAGGSQEGQPSGSEKPKEKIDPKTDPGGAMQEILKDREQQQKQQQKEQQKQQGSNQRKSEEKSSEGNKSKAEQPNKEQGAEGNQGQNKSPNQQPKDQGKSEAGSPENKQGETEKKDAEKGNEGKGSEKGVEKGSEKGAEKNAEKGSQKGEEKGSEKSSEKGSEKGDSGNNTEKGSEKGAEQAPEKGSPKEAEKNAEKGTEKNAEKGAEQGTGKPAAEKPDLDKKTGEMSPGEKSPDDKQPLNESKKTDKGQGGTTPQEGTKPGEKRPGPTSPKPEQKKTGDAQSPGIGKNESKVQDETGGDRKGGGEEGGGKNAKQPGVGSPGSHSPSDQGAEQSNEPADGKVGNKAGDQSPSKQPTGSAAQQKSDKGEGSGTKKPDGKNPGENPTSKDDSGDQGTPSEKPADGGVAGQETSEKPNAKGQGKAVSGGEPGEQPAPKNESAESPADEANLKYAQSQTELALEYLRDQLAKEKPELLEKLSWSKDEAKEFLQNWENMKRQAAEKGAAGDAARKQLNDTLGSLGLRPRGTEIRHGGTAKDQPQTLHDSGRHPAPPDWAEHLREYTRGVAGGERKKSGQ